MGSVISYEECEQCGFAQAHDEFWYKTGEQYRHCSRCGYTESAFIREDADKTKSIRDLEEEDWIEQKYGGQGVATLKMKNSDTDEPALGFFTWCLGPKTEGKEMSLTDFKELYEHHKENNRVAEASYTHLIEDQWIQTDLINDKNFVLDDTPPITLFEQDNEEGRATVSK